MWLAPHAKKTRSAKAIALPDRSAGNPGCSPYTCVRGYRTSRPVLAV
jgi:hypothetical protein